MKIRDLMDTDVVTIPTGTRYADVARILHRHEISGAPVVDPEGRLIGVVSEKDLFRVMYPHYESYYLFPEQYSDHERRETKATDIQDHPVEIFMSKKVVSVEPDMPVMRAGAIMIAHRIHRLPVAQDGKLIGIVTRRKIYRAIIEQNYGSEPT